MDQEPPVTTVTVMTEQSLFTGLRNKIEARFERYLAKQWRRREWWNDLTWWSRGLIVCL